MSQAYAFDCVDGLPSCFGEVRRVMKVGGLFVWSGAHPCGRSEGPQTLRLSHSHFETGKSIEGAETGCAFASVRRTVSDYFNPMVEAGFVVERMA